MTSAYQNSVVGCVQDIPLANLPPGGYLYITVIQNWANYRWVVQPLYGVVTPSLTYIHESNSYAADGATSGAYDTGWHQYNAAGYAAGDVLPSGAVNSKDWYTSRSLPVPTTVVGGVQGLPAQVPLGNGCTGVRVTSFVYFGSFDANSLNISMATSDASGLTLTPLSPGYYAEAATGKVYRDSSVAPYPGTYDLGTESLGDVVTRICIRGGLTAADIDVTDLAGIEVMGYAIAK
jgi:hypothetical protein